MPENRRASAPLITFPIVLGPTGSGKSALSLFIARNIDGEIVNFDSVQVYRGFDVGTAKVPAAERQGIPHHLIDILEPTALFTAGDFARIAEAAIREIGSRGRIPVLVGGTGFYLRALLHGLSPAPRRDDAVRFRLQERERKRPGSLHRILRRLDPVTAARVHVNDKNKTMRAVEVRLLERAPLSSMFEHGRTAPIGLRSVKIGLDPPRDVLYARLNERTREMFHPPSGNAEHSTGRLFDEVRRLLAAGVPQDAKPFESLGYKQAIEALAGRISEAEALESTQQETRRYAKRQLTWFRKEQDVQWIAGFGDDPQIQDQALAILRSGGIV